MPPTKKPLRRKLRKTIRKSQKGGLMRPEDYDRMFSGRFLTTEGSNVAKQIEALADKSYLLKNVKGSKYGFSEIFYRAPEPTQENLLNLDNYNSFLQRKYYETVLWDQLRTVFKLKVRQQGDVFNIGQCKKILVDYLKNFLYFVIKHKNGGAFLDELFNRFESKKTIFLTGIIDYTKLISELRKNSGANDVVKHNIENIINTYCSNIRNCLTLIDFFVKTFEKLIIDGKDSNGKIIMEYYVGKFDNCIRVRDDIRKLQELTPEFIKKAEKDARIALLKLGQKGSLNSSNKTMKIGRHPDANQHKDDVLLNKDIYERGKFCIKDYSLFCEKEPDRCDKKNDCANVYNNAIDGKEDMIEPYNDMEKSFILNLYNGTAPQFESGINTFYLKDRPLDTVDIFAAGISGHTAEIGLMFHIFTDFKIINEAMTQRFIAVSALVWMLDYFHHSLREILLASLIHFKQNEFDILSDIDYLYSKPQDGQSISSILDNVSGIIQKLLISKKGAAVDLRKYLKLEDKAGANLKRMESMIDFFLSSTADKLSDSDKERLISVEECIKGFKPYISQNKPTLEKEIVWPKPEARRGRHPLLLCAAPHQGLPAAAAAAQDPHPGLGGPEDKCKSYEDEGEIYAAYKTATGR